MKNYFRNTYVCSPVVISMKRKGKGMERAQSWLLAGDGVCFEFSLHLDGS